MRTIVTFPKKVEINAMVAILEAIRDQQNEGEFSCFVEVKGEKIEIITDQGEDE